MSSASKARARSSGVATLDAGLRLDGAVDGLTND